MKKLSVVGLYIVFVGLFNESGWFLSVDTGLRLIQVRALIASGWASYAVPHVGPALFAPYYSAFFVVDDQIFLSLSPWFTLWASLLFWRFGAWGLPVVPVFGAVAVGWASLAIAQELGLKRARWAWWVSIFGTPVAFYAVNLWDMTTGAGFAMVGLYFVLMGLKYGGRGHTVAGGALLAFGAAHRVEIFVFIIAVVAVLALRGAWQNLPWLALGGVPSVGVVWAAQWRLFGHPLAPIPARQLGLVPRLDYLAQGDNVGLLGEKLNLLFYDWPAGILLLGLGLGLLMVKNRWAVLALALGYAGLFALSVAQGEFIFGLFSACPVAVLMLPGLPRAGADDLRFVRGVGLLYVGLMVALWPADGGLQWGARYLLTFYPLAAIVAVHHLAAPGRWGKVVRGLVVLSVVLQFWAVFLQATRHHERLPQMAFYRAGPDLVLTPDPFLYAHMPLPDKTFLVVRLPLVLRR